MTARATGAHAALRVSAHWRGDKSHRKRRYGTPDPHPPPRHHKPPHLTSVPPSRPPPSIPVSPPSLVFSQRLQPHTQLSGATVAEVQSAPPQVSSTWLIQNQPKPYKRKCCTSFINIFTRSTAARLACIRVHPSQHGKHTHSYAHTHSIRARTSSCLPCVWHSAVPVPPPRV